MYTSAHLRPSASGRAFGPEPFFHSPPCCTSALDFCGDSALDLRAVTQPWTCVSISAFYGAGAVWLGAVRPMAGPSAPPFKGHHPCGTASKFWAVCVRLVFVFPLWVFVVSFFFHLDLFRSGFLDCQEAAAGCRGFWQAEGCQGQVLKHAGL